MDGATAIHCDRLIRTFESRYGLSIERLRTLIRPDLAHSVASGHVWSADRGRQTPLIVLSGWACEQRILECGRRQIFSFLLSGDLLNRGKADIVSLTPMLVLDASDISAAAADDPALARLLQDMLFQRTHYIYEHIVRLGTQNALDRAYDLLSELFERLRNCGTPNATSVPFPITQESLADMLGMSPVHVNRVLQQMRREGALAIGRGRLTVYPRDIALQKSA